ncbi:hypothetical protein WJX84_000718 [Apatococcus fuscideae]|uniref:SET domain-containing protein n=1 Tax=Apatococcus fuscideae TaxID=2026836 RepID=A0AAW1T0R9_9CHLO
MEAVNRKNIGPGQSTYDALSGNVNNKAHGRMLIVVRQLEIGSNDLPRWACPLCQMEQHHFQGFKTLHKHLYEMHPEQLVHMISIAYLAAFWSGSVVSDMCLRVMDWLELHLEPDQSLNDFRSLAPPRPTWWPANDPEYFSEELTLDPWVSIAVKPIPMEMERAESGPLPAIHQGVGELPEAAMARSRSEETLTRETPNRQSIDNSHPAIRGRQPAAPSSMQQLLGRLDPDRQLPASQEAARRPWPAALRKPPRHPKSSPEKLRLGAGPQESARRLAAYREPIPQEMPGVQLRASMEELGLLDPYQEQDVMPHSRQFMQQANHPQSSSDFAQPSAVLQPSDLTQGIPSSSLALGPSPQSMARTYRPASSPVSRYMVAPQHHPPVRPPQSHIKQLHLAQHARRAQGMRRSRSVPQELVSVGMLEEDKMPYSPGEGQDGHSQDHCTDLTACETLQVSPSPQKSYKEALVRAPARQFTMAPNSQSSYEQPVLPVGHQPKAAASQQVPGSGVEHSYFNLEAAQMRKSPLKEKYAEVIKGFDQAALGSTLIILQHFSPNPKVQVPPRPSAAPVHANMIRPTLLPQPSLLPHSGMRPRAPRAGLNAQHFSIQPGASGMRPATPHARPAGQHFRYMQPPHMAQQGPSHVRLAEQQSSRQPPQASLYPGPVSDGSAPLQSISAHNQVHSASNPWHPDPLQAEPAAQHYHNQQPPAIANSAPLPAEPLTLFAAPPSNPWQHGQAGQAAQQYSSPDSPAYGNQHMNPTSSASEQIHTQENNAWPPGHSQGGQAVQQVISQNPPAYANQDQDLTTSARLRFQEPQSLNARQPGPSRAGPGSQQFISQFSPAIADQNLPHSILAPQYYLEAKSTNAWQQGLFQAGPAAQRFSSQGPTTAAQLAPSDPSRMSSPEFPEEFYRMFDMGSEDRLPAEADRGESILDELPVVLTVSHALKQSYCSVCLRFIPSEALSACLCGTCQEACCCSTGCAAHHNAELCRLLAHLDWTGLNRELQDSLRLVAQLQCMANDAASRDILQQLSQLAAMPADGPGAQLLASRLAAVLQPQQQGLSAEAVQTLMGTEAMNGFGIAAHASMNAGRDQIRGSVLCLQASMMNHDCLPNAARFDDFDSPGEHNNRLSFRALQDIPAGEEITHQYFPLDWSLEERQEQCREVFGFQCNCGRCQVEQQK